MQDGPKEVGNLIKVVESYKHFEVDRPSFSMLFSKFIIV